jgi:hypothetical protein
MKSPCSLREGRFHPPKCRGKYIYSSKILGPFPNFLIIPRNKFIKTKKRGAIE